MVPVLCTTMVINTMFGLVMLMLICWVTPPRSESWGSQVFPWDPHGHTLVFIQIVVHNVSTVMVASGVVYTCCGCVIAPALNVASTFCSQSEKGGRH